MKLATKTYWKVGGEATQYREVVSIEELKKVAIESASRNTIIGNGTNVLFDSQGYDGTVIKLGKQFSYIRKCNDNTFEVGASTWIPLLVRKLSTLGYGGLEHCIGIPATVGGLTAMNGGSQRKSISTNILKVKGIDSKGNEFELGIDDCEFGYRKSIFLERGYYITSVVISVSKIKKNANRRELLKILIDRRNKFPRKIPNCGSVFKSSPELFKKLGPPGYIIESLGLKGVSIGGAKVSEMHANFILNVKDASSDDILSLVSLINEKCNERYGFKMESEAIFFRKDGCKFSLDKAEL
ncbi:UDP-N-acetylmuramate dehydrogenase [Vibrio astriarenae]